MKNVFKKPNLRNLPPQINRLKAKRTPSSLLPNPQMMSSMVSFPFERESLAALTGSTRHYNLRRHQNQKQYTYLLNPFFLQSTFKITREKKELKKERKYLSDTHCIYLCLSLPSRILKKKSVFLLLLLLLSWNRKQFLHIYSIHFHLISTLKVFACSWLACMPSCRPACLPAFLTWLCSADYDVLDDYDDDDDDDDFFLNGE